MRRPGRKVSRRRFLQGMTAAAGALGAPSLFLPRRAFAARTAARGSVKHLIYVRLAGGFRFTAAYNGDVAAEFNPFGKATGVPSGVEWGPSALLSPTPWLDGDDGMARQALGMQSVVASARRVAVLPCVDHEPDASRADGNHGSALDRFVTGQVGGDTAFLTMVNYGLRQRVADAMAGGETPLPAVSFGDAGMAKGFGIHAPYRPPVLQGDGFERFGYDPASALPSWAQGLPEGMDERFRQRLHASVQAPVDSYVQSREATSRYASIFGDPVLKVQEATDDMVDGISNEQLRDMLGTDRAARDVALALRLFRFGCPAVYLNQGGYDLHSGEEDRLPERLGDMNRLMSGLFAALERMVHPDGGSYWDRTLVVLGSEFGRTARGGRFNSAKGSDHGGDLATRWMSMPMFGGVIDAGGIGGRSFGRTRASDLSAEGKVYSYRSVLKTLLDLLGAEHDTFFPGDDPIGDLFG